MQMYTKKHFVNASELSGEKNHTGYQYWYGLVRNQRTTHHLMEMKTTNLQMAKFKDTQNSK